MKSCRSLSITGIVQGVGFRPFVYSLAKRLSLAGYVLNTSAGVSIELEGDGAAIDRFVEHVREEPPPQAAIFDILIEPAALQEYDDFVIRESAAQKEQFVPVSPEIATCPDCIEELFDPADRRYRYPFLNCSNCFSSQAMIMSTPGLLKWIVSIVAPGIASGVSPKSDAATI